VANILTTAEPETKTSGNWPYATLNGGPAWHLNVTMTNASTHAQHTGSDYHCVLASNDNGGFWLTSRKFGLYDQSSASLIVECGTLTWNAGAVISITINIAAGTNASSIVIANVSGLTAGAGTTNFTIGSNNPFSNVTLGIGIYAGGGYNFPGSLSNVDDTVSGYTITAETGNIPITGTAASTLFGRKIVADSASISITGTDAGLRRGYAVVAESESVPIVGTDAGLLFGREVEAETSNVPIAGTDADLIFGQGSGFVLDAETSNVPIAGTATDLRFGRLVTAEADSVPVSGTDAGLLYGRRLDAEPGSVPIAGVDADLRPGWGVAAESEAVPITGTDVGLRFDRRLDAEAGAVPITATDAGLELGYAITAETSNVPIAGTNASLLFTRLVVALSAAVPITGTNAALVYSGSLSIGDHGYDAAINAVETGTNLVFAIDTQATGSMVVVVHGGNATDLDDGITDDNANTYTAIDAYHQYVDWSGYGVSAWRTVLPMTGGAGHEITAQLADFDEGTAVGVEIIGGKRLLGYSWTNVSNSGSGSTISSGNVTISEPAVLLAFWWGASTVVPGGAPFTASPNGNFAVLESFLTNHANGEVPFSCAGYLESTPGTYSVTWTHTPDQGGQVLLLAIGGAAVLEAEAGSVPITASDAGLLFGREVEAETSNVPITGTDADLRPGRRIDAEAGSVPITGTEVVLTIARVVVAETSNVPIAGTDATLELGFVVAAETSNVPITGTDASLLRGMAMTAEVGAVPITGSVVDLRFARVVTAEAGAVAITGTDTDLRYGFTITAEGAAIPVTGTDVGLYYHRRIDAQAGSIPITGTDADLQYSGGAVVILPSSYTVSAGPLRSHAANGVVRVRRRVQLL
jgi:hypothetical protein